MQTDDCSHHYLPHRPQCPLSQLLIGSDACAGRGDKKEKVMGLGSQYRGEEWGPEELGAGELGLGVIGFD